MENDLETKNSGRPNYEPTEQDKQVVLIMAGSSIKQDKIAFALGISEKTLRKYYSNELSLGSAYLDKLATESLLHHLEKKDKTMTIFYLKTRCKWTEKPEGKDWFLPDFSFGG